MENLAQRVDTFSHYSVSSEYKDDWLDTCYRTIYKLIAARPADSRNARKYMSECDILSVSALISNTVSVHFLTFVILKVRVLNKHVL